MHKNIVETKDSFYDEDKGMLIMVMEYCEVGDLTRLVNYMRLSGGRFSEPSILTVMAQSCEALAYTHS